MLKEAGLTDDEKEKKMEALTADPASCPLHVSHPPNGLEFGLGCSMCEDKKDEKVNEEAAKKAKEEAEQKAKAFEALKLVLRGHPNGVKFNYEGDFDENGLFFYLGTCGRTQKWTNPGECSALRAPCAHRSSSLRSALRRCSADAGYVELKSSGMMGDSAPLSAVTGRDLVRCVTKPLRNSWIQLDLVAMSFEPTHYTLKHYSSWDTECLRNWVLEGSNDGLSWTAIMQHINDKVGGGAPCLPLTPVLAPPQALDKKGATHTWPLKTNGQRYRMFRLIQVHARRRRRSGPR